MNVSTLVVGGGMMLLLLLFSLALIVSIGRNLVAGHAARRVLGGRLDNLLLKRLLARGGLDSNVYLHRHRFVDIEHQMKRCEACKDQGACEAALAEGRPKETFKAFCPNYDVLFGDDAPPGDD